MDTELLKKLKSSKAAVSDYLDTFDKSPYSYPSNGLQKVAGKSDEKGCWHQQK